MPEVQTFLKGAQKNWRLLAQGSVFIVAIISHLVLPPPIWDFREDKVWQSLSELLVPVLIGLMFIPASLWSKKRHTWGWWAATILLLFVSIYSFFYYQNLRSEWTVPYAGTRAVVGTEYTQEAIDYKRKVQDEEHTTVSDERLLGDFVGKTEDAWKGTAVHRRRLILAGVYLAGTCFFAITLIALVQALACNSSKQ